MYQTDKPEKDVVKKAELKQFKPGVKTFLIALEKLFEKSPLGSALVCNSVVFDTVVIATMLPKELKSKLEKLLRHVIQLKIVIPNCYVIKFYPSFVILLIERLK